MDGKQTIARMLSAVDSELRESIDCFFIDKPVEFKEIIKYQMGWEKKEGRESTSGKRLRPIMLLAAVHALGGDWQKALPAAAAVELVHNFSLVHDDIQDRSETRRGKPTIWIKWGEAQAINVGDALLAAAFLELQRLNTSLEVLTQSLQTLTNATLNLTTGQYLDLAFEKAENIPFSDYWEMVKGKTGALFGACFALAAIANEKDIAEIARFNEFGNQLGDAFQVQDDYLGIFGDGVTTGKSTASDLVERKKTFPILYGLEKFPEFRALWLNCEKPNEDEILMMKEILVDNQMREINQSKARELLNGVEDEFTSLFGSKEESQILHLIISDLLNRSA